MIDVLKYHFLSSTCILLQYIIIVDIQTTHHGRADVYLEPQAGFDLLLLFRHPCSTQPRYETLTIYH